MTLNQHERAPLPVEDQTIRSTPPPNGFLDRLQGRAGDGSSSTELIERAHAELAEVRAKIAGGDWSEETQKAVHKAVEAWPRTSATTSTRRASRWRRTRRSAAGRP